MPLQRWSGDTRGYGATSGFSLLPALDALRDAMTQATWIAEEPEAHLLPHIRRACETPGSSWRLVSARTDEGVLVVSLRHKDSEHLARLRADALALIGSFVEANTFIREWRRGDEAVFEVVTGMLDGDGAFAGHGHLVRLVVLPDEEPT